MKYSYFLKVWHSHTLSYHSTGGNIENRIKKIFLRLFTILLIEINAEMVDIR